jgi:branched-chain amino acid transport system substrate-binding protein
MRRPRARFLALTAVTAVSAAAVAACGGGTSTTSTANVSSNAITVGISEPLTGAFSADGVASQKGYQLWASDVNAAGGLLGHQVRLLFLNDNSLPNTTAKQYTTLIATDHVNFVLGPFSSLLTVAAGPVAEKYGYALPEGSGTAPSVFQLKLHDLFGVSTPDAEEMTPFATWVSSLTGSARPKTAAYPMESDPFADPPVQATEATLQNAGIRTVYTNTKNPITANSTDSNMVPIAKTVAADHPDMVVLGSVDVPTVLDFVKAFEAANFTPKIFIAASGPDQGLAFENSVGPANATGIMVPDGWYGGFPDALSHVMVQDYIAKFGGTAAGINADVAEAYSSGEVLADAVAATKSLDNAKIIAYLHSGVTLQTVQGPAHFDSVGENTKSPPFIFQWQNGQFVQVLPTDAAGSSAIETTKPPWSTTG